jgi:Ca2+:H+ antiporter
MRKSDLITHLLNWSAILRPRTDRIRRYAHQSARSDKKAAKRHTRSESIQLESGLATRSLGDLSLSEDQHRQQDMSSGLDGPEHASTFPLEGAGSEHGTPRTPFEPSMASQDPINVSTPRGPDSETVGSSQTRQRKGGILGKFRHHDDDEEWEKKSRSEPNFTFASQLKATLLNSWINVLLIAAPVGSMLLSFSGLIYETCADSNLVQLRCMPLR